MSKLGQEIHSFKGDLPSYLSHNGKVHASAASFELVVRATHLSTA